AAKGIKQPSIPTTGAVPGIDRPAARRIVQYGYLIDGPIHRPRLYTNDVGDLPAFIGRGVGQIRRMHGWIGQSFELVAGRPVNVIDAHCDRAVLIESLAQVSADDG